MESAGLLDGWMDDWLGGMYLYYKQGAAKEEAVQVAGRRRSS